MNKKIKINRFALLNKLFNVKLYLLYHHPKPGILWFIIITNIIVKNLAYIDVHFDANYFNFKFNRILYKNTTQQYFILIYNQSVFFHHIYILHKRTIYVQYEQFIVKALLYVFKFRKLFRCNSYWYCCCHVKI